MACGVEPLVVVLLILLVVCLILAVVLTIRLFKQQKSGKRIASVVSSWLMAFLLLFILSYFNVLPGSCDVVSTCQFGAGIGPAVDCDADSESQTIRSIQINGFGYDIGVQSMNVTVAGCTPVCDRANQFCGLTDEQGVWAFNNRSYLVIPCAMERGDRIKAGFVIEYIPLGDRSSGAARTVEGRFSLMAR